VECVVQTSALSKRYRRTLALDGVDIEIQRGQVYGLVGLNGAGKTTLMRALAGLIAPTSGSVELFGESTPAGLAASRRRIGQMIESPRVYPGMTAAQNLEIQRRLGGVPDARSVGRVLELVGLGDVGKKSVRDFSFGMKQRLGIALALITDPELLILDEPANGLDPLGIMDIRVLVRTLARDRGVTVLISSHILGELAQVATHFGVLHRGRLVKQLSAQELRTTSHRYLRLVARPQDRAVTLIQEAWGVRDFRVVSPTEIDVYQRIDEPAQLNALLVGHGVEVDLIERCEQPLDDYILNLIGGR